MNRPAWTSCTCPSQTFMIVCSLQLHQLDLCWFLDGQVCMYLMHLSTTDLYDCLQFATASTRSLLVSGGTSMHEPIAPVHHIFVWLFCILQLQPLDLCLFLDGQACMNLLHLSMTECYDCLQFATASTRSLLVSGWTNMHEHTAPVHHRPLWLCAAFSCISD